MERLQQWSFWRHRPSEWRLEIVLLKRLLQTLSLRLDFYSLGPFQGPFAGVLFLLKDHDRGQPSLNGR